MSDKGMCEHPDIETVTRFARIVDSAGKFQEFRADLQLRCSRCGVRFAWIGVPHGHRNAPTVSLDRFVLTAPMEADAHMTSLVADDDLLRWPGQ